MLKKIVGGLLLFLIGLLSSWVHEACFDGKDPREGLPLSSAPGAAQVPGMVLVDFADGTTAAAVDERERGTGVDLSFNSVVGEANGVTIGSLGDPADDADQLERLRSMPGVESVEPLYLYEASFKPDDPDRKLQWHLDQIGMEAAWDLADGSGVTVAVLDTGIAYEDAGRYIKVPDLGKAKFAKGYNFVDDNERPYDGHGHGTHVAGTIAQSTNNKLGVAGVAYAATLMPVKVLSDHGGGTSADIADGIRWAADHGAKVLNLSLGGGGYSAAMAKAVEYARAKGAVVVCAAGNGSRGIVEFPAAYPGAVAVSAVRYDGKLAPYSSWGKELDLAAPGGDKTVDQNGDGFPDGVLQNTIGRGDPSKSAYEWYQGTSMATPHVAGAAALLFSAGMTSPDEVESALFASAKDAGAEGWDEKYGHGILNAEKALGGAGGGAKKGAGRLVAGLLALGAAVLTLGRRKFKLSGLAIAALVLAACGFFFLPWIWGGLPGAGVLAQPVAAWPGAIFGGGPVSPFWYSAALPLTVAFLTFGFPRGRQLAAGFALGMAGFLAWTALFGEADIAWMPWKWLEAGWLWLNAAASLLIGRALLSKER